MPDRKSKKKNQDRTRIKLKERRCQEESEDATRSEEVEEVRTSTQSAPSRQQLDLFHFYKKRVRERDYLAHATENAGASIDFQTSDNVSMNSEADEVLVDDDGLRTDSAQLTGAVINDDATLLSTCQGSKTTLKTCTDIPHTSYPKHQGGTCANVNLNTGAVPNSLSDASSILPGTSVSEVIATEECVGRGTDEGSIDQGQSNTSMTPPDVLFKPINQEILTPCAAPSQLPLLSHAPQDWHPFLLDRSSSHPSQRPLFLTTDPNANNSTSLLIDNNRKEQTNAEGALDEGGIVGDSSLSTLVIGRCRMPKDELFSKEAALDSSNSHYDTAIVSSVPEPVPEYGQVVEQASEHGSEKEMRCDRLGTSEEASESICTALQNVNANGPGVEEINAIKSIPIPDRFMEGGESIITPIDLTTSPRPEHGPLTNIAIPPRTQYELIPLSQEDLLPNEIRASGSRLKTLPGTTASHGTITSPTLGSRGKPIEVEILSSVTGRIKSSAYPQLKPSSNKATFRKSQPSPLQIHPFFQKTTTAATLAVNSGRDPDRDVGLGINLELSSTGHANQNFGPTRSANFRSDVRKPKGNKDKSSDEAQCDTGVDTDVIFTRSTSEKTRFWDFISKSTNSTSSSNAIRTTATSPPSVFSKTRALLAPWPNSENQHVLKSQRLTAKPSPFPRGMAKLRGADEIGIEKLLAEQLGLNREHVPSDQELLLVRPSLHILNHSAIRDALKTIPSEHQDHPGISRVVSVIQNKGKERRTEENADTPRGHSLWTTKWKPRRAAEVLGNESQALYLREWLKALSIQSLTVEKGKPWEQENTENKKHKRKRKVEEQSQRRMVIRSIEKRKRRRIENDEDHDEDTNWIVADDGDDKIDGNAGGDAGDWLPNAGNSPGNDCNDREDFEKEFSKRLTNTILIAGKPGTGKTSAVYACAAELGWEIFEVYPGIGKRAGMNIAELVGSVGKNHIVGKGVRQSIILLEEVDILFKEDVNFWTSVVNIISTSHRPVILTCNDASVISQDLLPLQKCLKFEACPRELALSFLQAVCIAEGYDVTRKRVEEEYALMGGDEPEWPASVAFPSEALPSADLRSALNRLQMGLRFPVSQEEDFGNCIEWSAEGHTLKDCELYAESVSYVNAYLDRIEQKLGFETQGDDEIGYTRLTNPEEYSVVDVQKTDFNNYSMACDALAWCRHVVNVPSTECKTTQTQTERHWLIQTRRLLARQAASFLDEIISLPGPLLPRHEAVLEYIPAVRWLVALDDAQDVPPHSAVASRRRWRHVRYMDLSKEALSAVREYYDMFFPRCIT